MNKTGIEWCDYTLNVMHGCEKVSPGCDHCYAERFSKRLAGMGVRGYRKTAPFEVTPHPWNIEKLRKVPGNGKRVFLNSMGDLFHEDVEPLFIALVLGKIADTPRHTFIILTKRSAHLLYHLTNTMIRQFFYPKPLPNLWLGVSVENQRTADERIPILLQIPAAVRFVSYEPAIEAIDFSRWFDYRNYRKCEHCNGIGEDGLKCPICSRTGAAYPAIDWIIVGGETGPGARFFNPAWAAAVWTLCQTHMQCYEKTRFFWKGEMAGEPWQVREFPGGAE